MQQEKNKKNKGKPLFTIIPIEKLLDTSLVISTEETAQRIANGDAYVIRFKTAK
jgi:glutamyl-tRNA synthetase